MQIRSLAWLALAAALFCTLAAAQTRTPAHMLVGATLMLGFKGDAP